MNRSIPRALIAIASLAALLAMVSPFTGAQIAFTPEDVEACPVAAGVVDPEFHSASRRVVFFDREARLKVAALKADGSIANACQGTVIDTGVALSVAGFPLVNGAEWAASQQGIELFYTRYDDAGRSVMARAYENGGWRTETLAGSVDRGLPIPSMDGSDPQSRLLYAHGLGNGGYELMWRESTDAGSERAFPAHVLADSGGAPRWVRGQRAITTTLPDAAGVPQAVRVDIDSGVVHPLTSGGARKDEVWMWSAPEFGGDWVFIAVVDRSRLQVWRQQGGQWSVVRVLNAPGFSGRPRIFSPEPYIVNGRSYVVMQLSTDKYSAGDIWITSIDPAQPLLRQVSDPATPGRVRSEPEWAQTPAGVFIYYTQNAGYGRASLRRARTGL